VKSKRSTPRERLGADDATKTPSRSRGAGAAKAHGRATPAQKDRRPSGRYTPPIPKSVKRSPRWYPWVLLSLLLVGVLCIILDYIQVLPASPTNWYVVAGLVAILLAALMATSYR
jgi:hypothetical protein